MFFDFFMTVPFKTHTLRVFLKETPEMASKVSVLHGLVMKRFKNIAPERRPNEKLCPIPRGIGGLQFIRGFPGSFGNDVRARWSEPPFPMHGGQDDVSYTQTP